MMHVIWMTLGLTGSVGFAADEAPMSQRAEINQAEYYRLSEELERLTQRGAWAGVERTFRACLQTGVSLSFDDYLGGAYSARFIGDVSATRDRLMAANEIREDKDTLDWIWDIDSNYGLVFVAGDVGTVELTPASMPFNPDQARAVTYAIEQVSETGQFEGLLPKGKYTFSTITVQVEPRVQTTRIDLRSDADRPTKKKKKKKNDD
jgi:hypothetical protein